MLRSLLALGLLAGCATPPALLAEANPDVTSRTVSLRPLAPVVQPDLPDPLQASTPSTRAASPMGAHAMTHGARVSATPLAEALIAYLALHDALASDRLNGIANSAQAFGAAFERATQSPPEGAPHFWHMRSDQAETVQASAARLAEARDLDAARSAFGTLSAPFVSLMEAHGLPEGFDLIRHTCGMQPDLPEGGVWLQRTDEVRNPYFGAAMQMCARESRPASDPAVHDGHPNSASSR